MLALVSCSKEEEVVTPPAPNKYTLAISAETGGTVSTEGGLYNEGSKITVTATPDGMYLFKEWSDGSTQNPREITVTSNLTLKASFIKKTYPLAVTVEGEGTVAEEVIVQGSTTETEYNAGTTVRLTATPNEGWVFAGWSGDVESEELVIEVPIEKGTSVSALFKRGSFELNITIEGEGTVKEEVIVQPGQYDFETVVRLTAIPADGYEFSGWSGDVNSEENPIEVEINTEVSLTASFIKKRYNLNIDMDGEGAVIEEVVVQPGQYDYETVVRLTAMPADGYVFSGWSGDVNSEENPLEVIISKEISLRVLFEKRMDPLRWRKPSNEVLELLWDDNWGVDDDVFVKRRLNYPWQSTILDYNNDGYLDLVTYSIDFANGQSMPEGYTGYERKKPVQFYLGSENGIVDNVDLKNHEKFLGRVHGSKVIPGDFNNDGLVDLLFNGSGYDAFPFLGEFPSVFFNSQSDGYNAFDFTDLVGYWHDVATGDIDNNGFLDIVLLELSPNKDSYVLWNNGGVFTPEVLPLEKTLEQRRVSLFDLNSDGLLDLFIGNYETLNGSYVPSYVLLGDGQGFIGSNKILVPEFQDPDYDKVSNALFIGVPEAMKNYLILGRFKDYSLFGNSIQVLEYLNGELIDVTAEIVEDPFGDGKFHFDLDYRDIDNDGKKELFNNRFSDFKANEGSPNWYTEWEYVNGRFARTY